MGFRPISKLPSPISPPPLRNCRPGQLSLMEVVMKPIAMLQAAVIGGLFVLATIVLGSQVPAPGVPRVAPQIIISDGGSYQTQVATDKPIYRTGEKLYVRGVVLRVDGHSPMAAAEN